MGDKHINVPNNYPIAIGDVIEFGNVEYVVSSISNRFEMGEWSKTAFLKHDATGCRKCLAALHCYAEPCPQAGSVVEWPDVIGG